MTRTTGSVGMAIAAAVAGVVVLLLLAPASGIDPLPPRCFSFVGYEVPCAGFVAPVAGVVAAGIVFLALWLRERRD